MESPDIGLAPYELPRLQAVLASCPAIERAIVYGSRAKGCQRRFSDIDITLVGNRLTLADLSSVSNAIDDLLLPYEVDISLYHTLRNQALIDHINRVGKTIYSRSHDS